jgi:hypothetical protein
MNTGEGDVWNLLTRWQGPRPDVGEDPNVANAWETGALDPTPSPEGVEGAVDLGVASYSTYGESPAESVYTECREGEAGEPIYQEYRED